MQEQEEKEAYPESTLPAARFVMSTKFQLFRSVFYTGFLPNSQQLTYCRHEMLWLPASAPLDEEKCATSYTIMHAVVLHVITSDNIFINHCVLINNGVYTDVTSKPVISYTTTTVKICVQSCCEVR